MVQDRLDPATTKRGLLELRERRDLAGVKRVPWLGFFCIVSWAKQCQAVS